MSTHNLCFGPKIRKIGIPWHTIVLLYIKVGFKGVFVASFPDDKPNFYKNIAGRKENIFSSY